MEIRMLCVPPLGTNCYFVISGKDLGIIDPGGGEAQIISYIEANGLIPSSIVLTHGHFDHAGAAKALREHFGIPVFVHTLDAPMLKNEETSHASRFGVPYHGFSADKLLEDGDTVSIASVPFTVLHTPGHTRGSICLLHGNTLFSGDTLFQGSVGRFDRKDKPLLKASIRRLLALSDTLRVYPGHGEATDILTEKNTNPFANFDWEWE